jgi:hypothetical protein
VLAARGAGCKGCWLQAGCKRCWLQAVLAASSAGARSLMPAYAIAPPRSPSLRALQNLDAQLNAERRVFVRDGRESGRGVQEIDICFLLDCTYAKGSA